MGVLHKINSSLKSLFPEKTYKNIRWRLLALYRMKLHVFTEAEIRKIFVEELGVKPGADVFVHSSVNQIKLDFHYYQLIRILREIVGPEGTIILPCWQDVPDFEKYVAEKKVFDVKRTPTILGILPDLVRREKDAYRSLSPYNSIVAIGKRAKEYADCIQTNDMPWGTHSPLYKLMEAGGTIIGIGVTTRYLTFVHCAEDNFPGKFPVQTRSEKAYPFLVRNAAGEVREIISKIPHSNLKYRDVPRFVKEHISPSIASDRTIKRTKFFTAKAKELYIEIQDLAKRGITIYYMK